MPATVRASSTLRMPAKIAAGNLTRDLDLGDAELLRLLELARSVKTNPGRYSKALSGRYLALLFEKPSLRTRLTFELAIKQLGGDAVTVDGPIGAREPVKDIARNLERWTNGIVARTFSQQTIDSLAEWAGVPVINALSDMYHPCQALADMLTLEEQFGDLRGRKLAFVGDGNNVAHSLMLCAARLGLDFALATPPEYGPDAGIVQQAHALAMSSGSELTITTDPSEAVAGAHAVYTDVWASMGQESDRDRRLKDFANHQVNQTLFAQARPDAVFLHCLPAKRGEEVTDAVIESERSVVFDQAENRLHVQKALLLMLL
ncbi:MAG: ornithine carbamoyltransferase [Acidobacteriota bacterium]|nr:ornithine carbamoyltransferase [Acidobacteriota bacterium]